MKVFIFVIRQNILWFTGNTGYSKGAICLLEKKSKYLFTGDTVYGDGAGNIKDFMKENYSEYESLDHRLLSCKTLTMILKTCIHSLFD